MKENLFNLGKILKPFSYKGEVSVYSSSRGQETFNISQQPNDRYLAQAQHFVSCIKENQTPACSLHEGLQVIRLVNQARDSLAWSKFES